MTEVITAPGVETIEHLDWKPSCQSIKCEVGHPVATHIQFFFKETFRCDCHPRSQFICMDCVVRIARHPDYPIWRCVYCNTPFSGHKSDYFRIEPLP